MGCDGVWEKFDSQKVADICQEEISKNQKDLKTTINNLLDSLIAGENDGSGVGMDNMSAVLIQLAD